MEPVIRYTQAVPNQQPYVVTSQAAPGEEVQQKVSMSSFAPIARSPGEMAQAQVLQPVSLQETAVEPVLSSAQTAGIHQSITLPSQSHRAVVDSLLEAPANHVPKQVSVRRAHGPCEKFGDCINQTFSKCPKLGTALAVAFFSFGGLASRVAIDRLLQNLDFGVSTTRAYVTGLPWSKHGCHFSTGGSGYFVQNMVGTMFMAIIGRHKKALNPYMAAGLSTGYCGSLTTFATWMGEISMTFFNGYIWQAFISILCMACVNQCGFRFGHFIAGCGMGDEPRCFDEHCGLKTLAEACCGKGPSKEDDEESGSDEDLDVPSEDEEIREDREEIGEDWALSLDPAPQPAEPVKISSFINTLIITVNILGILLYIAACSGTEYWAGDLEIAYAPFGALTRWWLSLFNPWFQQNCMGLPFGTLIANTLGCVFNAFAGVLAHRLDPGIGRDAIVAISTGFAGCLSTVSTFVNELQSDALGGVRMRFFYFLLSFGLAMAIETAPCGSSQ